MQGLLQEQCIQGLLQEQCVCKACYKNNVYKACFKNDVYARLASRTRQMYVLSKANCNNGVLQDDW